MDIVTWCENGYRNRFFKHFSHRNGIYVIDEQWDNLLILDACRYDTFKELNTIKGKLETRISRGSETTEFLLENFARHPTRENFADVVYIAGNPLVSSLVRDRFHKIYPVWDYGWDDQLGTVPPGNVANEALEARTKYPDKRMIVHFMQPHFPALTGRYENETGISGLRRIVKDDLDPVKIAQTSTLDVSVAALLKRGDLDRNNVLSAYQENLKMVLSYVAKLVEKLPGRTSITSDHGETFGERPEALYPFRVFGHPNRLHVKPLVIVPWFIIEGQSPPKVNRPKEDNANAYVYTDEEDAKIKDRLRKLGYD